MASLLGSKISPQFFSTKHLQVPLVKKNHLKDDEFSFENSQEVAGLLSHDHPDLNRGSIVLVINVDSLVGASGDLICSGMAALMENRHEDRLS